MTGPTALRLRPGVPAEVDACCALWPQAVADRDEEAPNPAVAARARAKFDAEHVAWIVAEIDGAIEGFVLVTVPSTGFDDDPPEAAYVGLLAAAPDAQHSGTAAHCSAPRSPQRVPLRTRAWCSTYSPATSEPCSSTGRRGGSRWAWSERIRCPVVRC